MQRTFVFAGLTLLLIAGFAWIAAPGGAVAGAILPTVTPGGASANDLIVFLANDDGEYLDANGNLAFMDGGWDVYSVRLDGSDLRRLTESPEDENNPVLSPDGTRIVFSRWTESLASPMFVMDVDGGGVRELAEDNEQRSPARWSPDGVHIAYNVLSGVIRGLVVLDVDSGARTVLAEADYMIGLPRWSPDGTQIAFTGHLDGNDDVYVINADGTNLRRISDHPANEYGPYWFPDGARIYYTRWDDGWSQWIADVNDPQPVQATFKLGAFSPDGTLIAAVEDVDGRQDVVIRDLNGALVQRLTHTPEAEHGLFWSSDGRQIVYFAPESGGQELHYDLFATDVAGGAARRLTFTSSAVSSFDMFP